MRRRILALVMAAAVTTGGVLAITESPADAGGSCTLIHVHIGNISLLQLCI